MAIRTAKAAWNGSLKEGDGTLALGSGAFEGRYSFNSRFEEGAGTNPEELLGAAHAGCFSMALAAGLGRAGFAPKRVETVAKVHLGKTDAGMAITRIDLETRAEVPGIDEATFQKHAEETKTGCIVSRALAAVEMRLDAKLV
jgi:osmotically inducible protein OsmC